ncbi:MAG: CvpA family protein [Treponema sp.]|mgnify:CR=1 FL=1|nr:CvpA family protein [Treponema sp.]
MSLPLIDFIFVVILVIFALLAYLKGIIGELFDKGAPIIGLWFGILFYKRLALSLYPYIGVPVVCNAIAFVLIFVLVFIIVKIMQQILQTLFSGRIFRQLDHTLGFIFGLVEGFAVIAIILLILRFQPWVDVHEMLESSIFYRILGKVIVTLQSAPVNNHTGAQTLESVVGSM